MSCSSFCLFPLFSFLFLLFLGDEQAPRVSQRAPRHSEGELDQVTSSIGGAPSLDRPVADGPKQLSVPAAAGGQIRIDVSKPGGKTQETVKPHPWFTHGLFEKTYGVLAGRLKRYLS